MKDVAGKVAFITGGASGLGLAMARSFTGAGMKVAIADVQDDALAAAREEFSESNANVITIKVDVTDRDALEEAAKETEAAFEKVHVVCNNAGVAGGVAVGAKQNKRRKNDDLKASKGRKIRYHGQEPLVNFTQANDVEIPAWAERVFSQLFASSA